MEPCSPHIFTRTVTGLEPHHTAEQTLPWAEPGRAITFSSTWRICKQLHHKGCCNSTSPVRCFTSTGAQEEVGCLLSSPWSSSDTWHSHSSSQGSHTSCASSSPAQQLSARAVTPPPAPEALIPCASQANPAATRKGCGRGGSLQFKIMLTSFIQILTYGLILSRMPRAMRTLSLVCNNRR